MVALVSGDASVNRKAIQCIDIPTIVERAVVVVIVVVVMVVMVVVGVVVLVKRVEVDSSI